MNRPKKLVRTVNDSGVFLGMLWGWAILDLEEKDVGWFWGGGGVGGRTWKISQTDQHKRQMLFY